MTPKETDHMLRMFPSRVKERSWVWIQMKDPLRIILHFIAFCIAFYCQLDLQWENYTMLVFCFIMLLFLIFQNIRNFILIALCYGRKYFLPRSIRISERKNLIWRWCSLSFPRVLIDSAGEKSPLTTSNWQNSTQLEQGKMLKLDFHLHQSRGATPGEKKGNKAMERIWWWNF